MNEITVSDWKNFNEIIESLPKKPFVIPSRYCFRGQFNSEWKLTPSISRIICGNTVSENKARFYEKQSIMEFKSVYHLTNEKLVFNTEMDELAILIDMQHYSCPTRFLDWSSSPYVALYFAVTQDFVNDGAVFIWDSLAHLAAQKELGINTRNTFSELIEIKHPDIVKLFLPTKKNERVYRQQGVFSASNNLLKSHCSMIDETHKNASHQKSSLTKLKIPKQIKTEFLDRLRFMNITANTLFPGLDGVGREIHESLIIRRWQESLGN